MSQYVYTTIRQLSSGTIAGIIGRTDYETIDRTRDYVATVVERKVRDGFIERNARWQDVFPQIAKRYVEQTA